MRRIAIILHKYGSFDEPLYFLRMISDVWREEGIDVQVVRALGDPVEADLAIQHIDLTVVPDDH